MNGTFAGTTPRDIYVEAKARHSECGSNEIKESESIRVIDDSFLNLSTGKAVLEDSR
jgi:hypothetical protein